VQEAPGITGHGRLNRRDSYISGGAAPGREPIKNRVMFSEA